MQGSQRVLVYVVACVRVIVGMCVMVFVMGCMCVTTCVMDGVENVRVGMIRWLWSSWQGDTSVNALGHIRVH
jgi:hypothetical protein